MTTIANIRRIVESAIRRRRGLESAIQQARKRQRILDSAARRGREIQQIVESAVRRQREISKLPEAIAGKPGTLFGDLFAMFSSNRSEKQKLDAAQRLVQSHFKHPIAPQRWRIYEKRFVAVLQDEANRHGRSKEEELKERVLASLFIAVQEMEPLSPRGGIKKVRKVMNDLVTKDLLGDDWRKTRGTSLDTAIEIPDELTDLDQGELEAGLTIAWLTNAAGLSERDAELIAGYYQGETLVEASERLGIKPGTVRQAFRRAHKKMIAAV